MLVRRDAEKTLDMVVKLLPKWVSQIVHDAEDAGALAAALCAAFFANPSEPHMVKVLSAIGSELASSPPVCGRLVQAVQRQMTETGDIFARLSPLLVLKVRRPGKE